MALRNRYLTGLEKLEFAGSQVSLPPAVCGSDITWWTITVDNSRINSEWVGIDSVSSLDGLHLTHTHERNFANFTHGP